jgi:hypothetical protein
MTAVSPRKDSADVKLSAAEEQPRRKGPCPTVFRLPAISGWPAVAIAGFMAMSGEMFASVTLLTGSCVGVRRRGTGSGLAAASRTVIPLQRAEVTT